MFGSGRVTYNPIMEKRDKPVSRGRNTGSISETTGNAFTENKVYTHKYPKNIIEISNASQIGKIHPTQKPIALMEYMIKTYSNKGDTVLDFAVGSGTTLIAAKNCGRNSIGIESSGYYHQIAKLRLAGVYDA